VPRPSAGTTLVLVGIVLIAVNLRPGVTAVGPLVDDIRSDLGLSNAGVGLLTTLPVLAFGALAPVAAAVALRIGIERTLGVALALIACGTLVRSAGAAPSALVGTVVLGAGAAAGNVLLPGLVKRDFPQRSGEVTSLYVTAMVAMAGVAPAVAVPLADGAGLGWRGALAIWAVLAGVAMAVWLPRLRERHLPPEDRARSAPWRSPLAWQITAYMGLQSFLFFGLVAWLPELLRHDGLGASRAGLMLAVMQFVSIASTIGVPVLAARQRSQRGLVAASAATMLAGFVGLLAAGAFLAPLWAGLLGLAGGSFLSLALTFLVVRARDSHQTAALSGMVQSGGYLLAASGPTAIGALRDLSGGWTLPLLAFMAVTLAALGSGLAAGRDRLV
jgi:MFS transporter, CP family, cyanate transporter